MSCTGSTASNQAFANAIGLKATKARTASLTGSHLPMALPSAGQSPG